MSSFLATDKKQPADAGWILREVHVGQEKLLDYLCRLWYNAAERKSRMTEYLVESVFDPMTGTRQPRVVTPDPEGNVILGGWDGQLYRIVRPGGSAALGGMDVQRPTPQPEAHQN